MIIQGSNNPLVIKFDMDISTIPRLVVTLWSDMPGYSARPVKLWENADMVIDGDTAACPITEAETKALSATTLVLEAKGLDGDGNTVFWDQYRLDLLKRRDRIITLTQTGGG